MEQNKLEIIPPKPIRAKNSDIRRKLSDSQIEEIQLLFRCRVPVKHIAEEYGVTPTALKYHVTYCAKLPIKSILQNLTLSREAA